LNEKKTLLGVDLVINQRILRSDVNEKEIFQEIQNRKAKIVVTPIGGQGFLFGRGNLQISKSIISQVGRENILVMATKFKLNSLKNRFLRIDTGDPNLDKALRGYIDVIVDYNQKAKILIK
jgi:predicted polyphosphate/ATP-dependent NAD kinase